MDLNLKKATLRAWASMLLKNGTITLRKYTKMIELINKITS